MVLEEINTISKEYKRHKIFLILIMSVLATCLEMIGIGSVIPLLSSLSNDSNLFDKFNFFSFNFQIEKEVLINYFLILFVSVFFIKNIFVYFYNLFQAKYLFSFYNYLCKEFLSIYLNQPYIFHLDKNSAILMRNIRKETGGYINGLKNLLIIINELLILVAIISLLIYFNYQLTIILIILISLIAIIFNKFISKRSIEYGQLHQFHDGKLNQTLHESFGSLKDIYLYNRSKNFIDRFIKHANVSKKVGVYSAMIGNLPRHWLEIIFILSLTSIVLYSSVVLKDLESALPLAGLFAISGIRLMPAVNKIITCYQQINLSKASIKLVNEELKLRKNIYSPNTKSGNGNEVIFNKVQVKNLSFKYNNTDRFIFSNVNFEINRGSLTGFIGKSGSGKTTLIDCILGLLPSQEGQILFNGANINENLKKWQKNIGYVPQNIYLIDGSIKENIAIGIEKNEIDDGKIHHTLKLSNLVKFVSELPEGIETNVGEKGIKISGGQKQRIGIARALYNNPSIVVFDEATNALDRDTEETLLNFIYELKNKEGLTILMITHRIDTLKKCDEIFKIENKKVSKINEK